MNIERNFQQALEEFDFQKIYNVMEFLKWHWYGNSTNPTIYQMKDTVNYLYKECLKSLEDENRDCVSVSTGGFEVSVYKCGTIYIKFIVVKSYFEEE